VTWPRRVIKSARGGPGGRGTRKSVSPPLAGCDDAAVSNGSAARPGAVEGLLGAGFQAVAAGDWDSAREAFTAALAVAEIPEAFFGLSGTLFWLGDLAGTIVNCEKAYAAARRRP
jgi:hypothetical protein